MKQQSTALEFHPVTPACLLDLARFSERHGKLLLIDSLAKAPPQ